MILAYTGQMAKIVALAALLAALLIATPAAGLGSSDCTRSCGNIGIPYPFGIEPGCFRSAGFNLTCDRSYQPPKLFLGDGTVQVLEVSAADATVRINSSRMEFTRGGVVTGVATVNRTWGANLPLPFFLSDTARNMVRAQGCNIHVELRGGTDDKLFAACVAICLCKGLQSQVQDDKWERDDDNCAGLRCCEADIDAGYSFYNIQLHKINRSSSENILGNVTIADESYNLTNKESPKATLSWILPSNKTCPSNVSMSAPECRSDHSSCQNKTKPLTNVIGYVCLCSQGYQGNPYVPGGCKDVDECRAPGSIPCYGNCTNTVGSFICQCPSGYTGNASHPDGCKDINECENPEAYSCYGTCENKPAGTFTCQCPDGHIGNPFTKGGCQKNSFTALSIGLGVGGGTSILLLALGAPLIARKIKLRKAKKRRENYFYQNHGLLLQQLISNNTDIGERMIITLRELEKATNYFDKARVIGGGAHGVVFKGIVDLRVVAIKRSKIVVQREINEFINEVAILSQVNHRNVVKLLGCCLEAEVPLLVYEFISNGTLHQHLHVERQQSLSWTDRMRIALEVARAISYLHSAASMPIFHRDIKSSNILLDDNLIAKVSDFGASRYIPIDQTGITTAVQGTIGYLDPMYYYTGRLTDKSDVFSFGVLLVELLTRKQPFIYRSNNGDSLVPHFVRQLARGNLITIIDPQVMEEEHGEVQEVAILATMCTRLRDEDRPTMRYVEMTLENLLVKKKHVPSITAPRRNDRAETLIQYVPIELITREASRQYTMEEEILLSARYPR